MKGFSENNFQPYSQPLTRPLRLARLSSVTPRRKYSSNTDKNLISAPDTKRNKRSPKTQIKIKIAIGRTSFKSTDNIKTASMNPMIAVLDCAYTITTKAKKNTERWKNLTCTEEGLRVLIKELTATIAESAPKLFGLR